MFYCNKVFSLHFDFLCVCNYKTRSYIWENVTVNLVIQLILCFFPLKVCISEVLVPQSCPTFWDPMVCILSGSSVHGILQARMLEYLAIPFSRKSSWPRDQTQVSCIAGRFFTNWVTREALNFAYILKILSYFILFAYTLIPSRWHLTSRWLMSCITVKLLSKNIVTKSYFLSLCFIR